MLVRELRSKDKKELNSLIENLKAELFMLRFKNSTGQLEQYHKISVIKKDIAKVFTVIYEKENNLKIVSKKQKVIKTPKVKSPKKEEIKIEVKEAKKVEKKEEAK